MKPQKLKGGGRKKGVYKGTAAQREFVKQLQAGQTQTDAARAAWPNDKDPNVKGCKMMKHPFVMAEMETFHAIKNKAREKAAEADALNPVILRRRIEEMLVHEAQNADTASARVRALLGLADIKGMRINRYLNLDREIEGKTEQELDFFARYGYFPDKAPALEPGRPGPGGAAGAGPQKG